MMTIMGMSTIKSYAQTVFHAMLQALREDVNKDRLPAPSLGRAVNLSAEIRSLKPINATQQQLVVLSEI